MKSTDLGRETKTLGLSVSSLCRNVFGPAYISFWWKSETTPSGYGELSFYVDDDQKPMTGSSKWTNQIYYLPDKKNYKVEWMYSQRKAGLMKGAGWIDDVDITPSLANATANIICAINAPDLACVGSTNYASTPHQNGVDYSWQIIGGKILGNPNNESIKWRADKCRNISLILKVNKQNRYSAICDKNIVIVPNDLSYNNMTIFELYKLSQMHKNNRTYVYPNTYDPLKNIYPNITCAIDNVSCGGTVIVARGYYNEDIIINKPLNLVGLDKNNTIIIGLGNTIYISSSNVKIENLTIYGGLEGVYINRVNNCNLININIHNCTFDGIYFLMSNSSRIQGCNIKNISKSSGIYLYSSNYSIILDNSIYNSRYGIQLDDSSDYSRIDNNTFSFLSEGILLSSKSNYNKINCTNKFYINNPCKVTGDKLENHICERYRVCTSS